MSEEAKEWRILAKPWDVIVCRNDHPCLIALKTIRKYEPTDATAFRAIGGTRQPRNGNQINDCRCWFCGEPVFVNNGGLSFKVKKHEKPQEGSSNNSKEQL